MDLLDAMPFARLCGLRTVSATAEEVVLDLDWSAERCTAGDALHGGALMALADSAGAVCAFLNLPAGAGTATVSSSTAFLGAVREGTVRARARPLHVGRRVIAVQTDLHAAGRQVATCTQTQAVLPAPTPSSSSAPITEGASE